MQSDAGTLRCPRCGEPVDVYPDPGGGDHQQYVEDCAVCCHPMLVQAERRGTSDEFDVVVSAEI